MMEQLTFDQMVKMIGLIFGAATGLMTLLYFIANHLIQSNRIAKAQIAAYQKELQDGRYNALDAAVKMLQGVMNKHVADLAAADKRLAIVEEQIKAFIRAAQKVQQEQLQIHKIYEDVVKEQSELAEKRADEQKFGKVDVIDTTKRRS